jgi:predicted nucleic acid-binding Zn ribbon protein
MCREEGLETPLNEYRLINAWSQVLGPAVQSYTKNLQIHNQVLFVTLTSSVLRHELLMNRKSLVRKLNEHVKAQVITDIVFR